MTSPLRLLILGASGFGREVLWVADAIPASARPWRMAGFLDDDVDGARASLAAAGVVHPVLGSIRDHVPAPDEVFFCAIGGSATRLRVSAALADRGARLVTMVHPSAQVHPDAVIGDGTIVGPLCTVGSAARLGRAVVMNASAGVGPDAVVEDGVFLGSRCDVMPGAIVETGAFLGAHVTVHPRARVGARSIVGIGSTVVAPVAAERTYLGVPARAVGV